MSKKGQRQHRCLESAPPSGQKPSGNRAPRGLETLAEELVAYFNCIPPTVHIKEVKQTNRPSAAWVPKKQIFSFFGAF